jgi:CRISPR-associated protein Csx14
MEAADVLLGNATGAFHWTGPAPQFHIGANGPDDPVLRVMRFLAEASVSSVAPRSPDSDTELSTDQWKIPTVVPDDDTFPYATPSSPATLPAVLKSPSGQQLTIDHWGDTTRRDAVKFWAGSRGKPGAALTLDALDLVRSQLTTASTNPFAVSAPQSNGFRLDWRRDCIPIDVGFSPNRHAAVIMLGYPIVEVMAALGLTHGRPHRQERLKYRYAVVGTDDPAGELTPINFHRVALGGTPLPFSQRFFEMQLGWPGKPGQARCILDVTEEIPK